ncbi:MAG: universal stress protein [Methanomicrobiaceae archaeon]|uniref:UspA domain-containing protein n=1 Tax=hydrocarbon metagenome TaxID=938273 RepID=A0A0W8FET4_9ZZZZ|nr:universal stress protein [Methanomicrobiaceae archaeon]MDD5419117.1 universal stress protein [Methanomicrobiaceae archaeon]
MFATMLFPVEISGVTERMFCAVSDLVRAGIREVTLLHVVLKREAEADPGAVEYSRKVLREWKRRLEAAGTPSVRYDVAVGIPWVEIIERAAQDQSSVILMGSHPAGILRETFLGNETENVLHHADRPVLILKLRLIEPVGEAACTLAKDRLLQRVLFATDFSPDAEKCIPFVEQTVHAGPEEVMVVHIQDLRTLAYATATQIEEFNRRDARRLSDLKQRFASLGFAKVTTVLRTGNAIAELLAIIASAEPTLVVIGAKGRSNLAPMMLGGVSETVAHAASSHVLVVR